ncbi:unnamed protein product, partial [Iphiclides podalirius]
MELYGELSNPSALFNSDMERFQKKIDASLSQSDLQIFAPYKKRSEVWENKTCLKGSGVTLSEFLTKSRHEVFKRARIHFGVKDCWTSEDRIVVLLPNKSRRRIERMSELEELIQRYPTPHNVQQVVSAPTARAGTSSQSEPVRTPSREPTTQEQPRPVRKCTKPKTVSK